MRSAPRPATRPAPCTRASAARTAVPGGARRPHRPPPRLYPEAALTARLRVGRPRARARGGRGRARGAGLDAAADGVLDARRAPRGLRAGRARAQRAPARRGRRSCYERARRARRHHVPPPSAARSCARSPRWRAGSASSASSRPTPSSRQIYKEYAVALTRAFTEKGARHDGHPRGRRPSVRALAAEQLARDGWSREQLLAHQQRAPARAARPRASSTRRTTARRSAPTPTAAEHLPTLTKATLMEQWDRIVCDPRLRRDEVEAHAPAPQRRRAVPRRVRDLLDLRRERPARRCSCTSTVDWAIALAATDARAWSRPGARPGRADDRHRRAARRAHVPAHLRRAAGRAATPRALSALTPARPRWSPRSTRTSRRCSLGYPTRRRPARRRAARRSAANRAPR